MSLLSYVLVFLVPYLCLLSALIENTLVPPDICLLCIVPGIMLWFWT